MFANPFPRHRDIFETSGHTDAAAAARRSNRRRITVFAIVFLGTLVPGLAWNLLRPAEYRASARVEISIGAVAPRPEITPTGVVTAEPAAPRNDLLTQVQVLNSRALLEEVLHRLDQAGPVTPGADVVGELQNTLAVSPVSGTDIVELQALGPTPQRLATVLNTLIDAYRDRLFAAHSSASKDVLANLRDEVERLDSRIADKRAQLATFRARTGVISSERGENEALARAKGLSESLNKANEDAAKADARVRALHESAASGRNSGNARDNPTVAAIEQRLSATREDLRDMERTYTPQFMAMDPTARALRARLVELEQQLATTRSASQQSALIAAEEDAAGARAAVERIRWQIEAQRREAQNFSGNFHQAQAMEDDLARLETARRNAMERQARLEASESARLPTLKLIEAASVPRQPWRPDYQRDALINLLASFLLGLLAMWFVELFNRAASPAMPHTVVVPQPWLTPALAMDAAPSLREPTLGPPQRAAPQLPAAAPLPRELSQPEIAALLAAADSDGRSPCALMLLGLGPHELGGLTRRDLDLASSTLAVRGASARTVKLPAWLSQSLVAHLDDVPDPPLFRNAAGQPLGAADVAARLACAALDAGLEAAAAVSPEVLRHTCIAWLIRQGVRFSDLSALVGQLSAEELAAYAALSPEAQRPRGRAVDPVMPALREPQFEESS